MYRLSRLVITASVKLIKMNKNILLLGMMILTGMSLSSCNGAQQNESQSDAVAHHDDHGHAHDYACPMHPHLQGHEGEKCNTCGMPLEKIKNPLKASSFKMDFHPSATEIHPGESVSLIFKPTNLENADLMVPLDVVHEKKIHLLVINQSLSWFDHIHPVYQADGSYVVDETFPSSGGYMLFADYKPSGGSGQIDRMDVEVIGQPRPAPDFKSPKTKGSSGDFSVALIPDDPEFLAQQEIHFDGVMTKNGKPFDVNDLQYYMDAKGHMIAIQVDSKMIVHIHPEIENGKLHFHAEFPKEGFYRMWLQFKEGEKLHTIDFTINAKKSSGASNAVE